MIRAGTRDDITACVNLWVAALEARDGAQQELSVVERARAKFRKPVVRFAVVGETPVAFALTVEGERTHQRRTAVLELLAVSPAEAGRGLGRSLLNDAVRAAALGKFAAVELDVRAGNDRAEKLYTSAGFESFSAPTPHPLGGPPMSRYVRELS